MPKATLAESLQLKELLETEQSYHASLTLLNEVLALSSGEYSSKLYEITPALQSVSAHIIENLKQTFELLERADSDAPRPGDNALKQRLGLERIILIQDLFSHLERYTPLFFEINEALRSAPQLFAEHNAYVRPKDPSGFNSLLIKPIQRGPRYELLLKEILKYIEQHPTSADERQKDMIRSLLETIQENIQRINEVTPKEPSIKPYQFGDLTYGLLFGKAPAKPETLFHVMESPNEDSDDKKEVNTNSTAIPEEKPASTKGYRFGDFTRSLIWGTPKNNVHDHDLSDKTADASTAPDFS